MADARWTAGPSELLGIPTASDAPAKRDVPVELPHTLHASKLLPDDGAAMQRFGSAVAVSDRSVLVGASDDEQNGLGAGAAYVFTHTQNAWTQQAKLIANSTSPGDKLGFSVALSGDTALVGAYLAHEAKGFPGAAYIFMRNDDMWTEQAELTASDGEGLDLFGHSVAIAGDTAVVGAMQGNHGTGAVYVFERAGASWVETAKLVASDGSFGHALGISVSIDGDTILAGAASARCLNGKYCGAAYVFTRNGTSWSEQAKLVASDSTPWDFFGRTVSLSGDRAVVGTYLHWNDDSTRGAAYVFERDNGAWTERAKVTSPDGGPEDQLGVAITSTPGNILMGACNDLVNGKRSGATYVFSETSDSWTQVNHFEPSDGDNGDSFGCAIAASPTLIAIASPDDDDLGKDAGAVYVYHEDPSIVIRSK